jgi:hypothetical protein
MDYRIRPLAPMSGAWEPTNLHVHLLDGRDRAIYTACIRAEATDTTSKERCRPVWPFRGIADLTYRTLQFCWVFRLGALVYHRNMQAR